jgi:serine/threonine protein kinase
MSLQHDQPTRDQMSAAAGATAFPTSSLASDHRQQAQPGAMAWTQAALQDPATRRTNEANVPEVWHVGDVILDQYEVTGKLGEGGMGTVYKVHHRDWHTDLAVKSPKPEIFAKAGGKENFIREAETWVNLGLHPHTVSCYYVRTLGGIPRLFAEYVAGGSLADGIRTRRLYEGGHEQALARILDIAIQFAWGLHYAHEQGLVHQDVKPANVMLTSDGTAKVTDFGLAKAWEMAGEASVAGTGQGILVSSQGMTPAYCSPEQAAGHALSRKTDIWSWGVSVLEMFVGGVTWMSGIVAREALASHEGQDPAIPQVPAEVVKLLARCFQQWPEGRPATMLDVATELQTIYARLVGRPYPREAPKPVQVLADSLNNRALSLLDLGKVEEAKQVWEQALQADPQHLETTYNRGVVLWRRGELTDEALVQHLGAIQTAQAAYLLARVHLERGDGDAALPLLAQAAQQGSGETDVPLLREQAQATSRCLRIFEWHTAGHTWVRLSADGRFALTSSPEKEYKKYGDPSEPVVIRHRLQLCDVATGRCLRVFAGSALPLADGRIPLPSKYTEPASPTTMLPEGLSADGRFALSRDDKFWRLWDTATGRCLHAFGPPPIGLQWPYVYSASLSADGRFVLTGSQFHSLMLWDTTTGQCLRVFERHGGEAVSVCLSADGRIILVGDENGKDELWDATTGQCLRVFEGHTGRVRSVCLSADGRFALSGGDDKTMRLWDTTTGQCLRVFEGHTNGVSSVCLSADGRFALSGGYDHEVRMYELDWELEAHNSANWDEGAWPLLKIFLTVHTPYAATLPQGRTATLREIRQDLTRSGHPSWNEQDFQDLIRQLQYAGYGWLRPEGVRRKLEEMAISREGASSSKATQQAHKSSLWSRLFRQHQATTLGRTGGGRSAMPGKLTLTITAGPKASKLFVFEEHDTLLFGRMDDCQVCLPDDRFVSRHHFLLEINPPDARIRDLGSLHGTYVNGRKYGGRERGETPEEGARRQYPQVDLHDGDEIKVGKTVFRVSVEAAASAPEPVRCQKCGRDVSLEVGPARHGDYVCETCRKQAELDPGALLLALLQQARQHVQMGVNLPDYQIERELGRGGMGAVYLARRRKDGQPVALKVMLSKVAVDDRARKMFLREMEATRVLRHPHLVEFLDGGAQGSLFYFLLEFCEGGDVAHLMEHRGGRLSLAEAGPILLQVLEGLTCVHEHGFVHRDLKPQNLLLRGAEGRWRAKVSDLGLAKSFEQAGFSGMTATGSYAGSFPFMPREQIINFKRFQPVSDVWAMGATCYHILTGSYPRQHRGARDQIEVVLNGDIVPIRARDPRIPPQVAEVIDRALANKPSERYQHAGEMYEAMANALQEAGGTKRDSS